MCSRCSLRRPSARCSAHGITSRAGLRSRKPARSRKPRPNGQLLTAAIAAVPETAAFGGGGWATAASALERRRVFARRAHRSGARGEHDRAIKYWQQAVAAADRLPYDEPPVWFYPVRESLGAALLAAGRAADAERVFRDDLVKHPRNGAIALRPAGGACETGQGRGCCLGTARIRRSVEERRHEINAGGFLDSQAGR